jgi:cobalt-zinc-cadmium efflux system membrane fusion protein
VNSPVAGRVVELRALPGAPVRRGDVLAVISSPEFGQSQAEARKTVTDLALAERSLARARELHEAGVIPLKELQVAEADFERARSERDRAIARERLYGGTTVIDQQYRLTAPIAGVVVDRRVTPGQEVRPDQGADAPLFVISDPTRLWIQLDVPEILSQEVQKGEAVRVTVPALPGEVFTARVEYIADNIDPQTRMVKARAAVENGARRLKAEMFVTADVEVPPSVALRVPSQAIFLLGDTHYAFVEESPGQFVRRQLRAEEATLGFMRVLGGLRKGDRVVSDGALLLQQLIAQKATAPRAPPAKGGSAPVGASAGDAKPSGR